MSDYLSKSFVYYGPGTVRTEIRKFDCGPTDIILRINVCGRCGTDVRLFRESHPNVTPPTILGHELAGSVVEVGKDVMTLTRGIGYKTGETLIGGQIFPPIGQRVTVQSRIARYDHGLMLIKNPIQNLSFRVPGAYAQYMKVTAEMIQSGSVLSVPDNVTDEEAALVEPAACALESILATPHTFGVDKHGRHIIRGGIKPGGRALIIGSGTLALIYGQLARIEGAQEVWFLVRSEAKKELCVKVLGNWAKFKVVPDYSAQPLPAKLEKEASLEKEFSEFTDGNLFDDIVLAAPSIDAQRLIFRLLNPNGYGVVACFAGLHDSGDRVLVDNLHYRAGKAIGTSGCSTRTMEIILEWLCSGKLVLKGYTSPRHYTLNDDPDDFFQTKADGRKPMLYPWE